MVLGLVLGAPGGARAQASARAAEGRLRADTSLVLVPVTVTNHQGAIVSGLDKERFAVLDDGQAQPIRIFHMEDAVCSVGIVLDISGSMAGYLNFEKAAVHAFLRTSNPGDDFFLVTVSSYPGDLSDPLEEVKKIDSLAQNLNSGGGTALIDGVYLALKHPRLQQKVRRVLLVISDGMDNNSRYSRSELFRELAESDTQVYTIAVTGTRVYPKGLQLARVEGGIGLMQDIAERSGGMSIQVREDQDPAAGAVRLATALRNQYVIGYYPPDSDQSGKWHKLRVKVDRSRTNVYTRSGYRAQ